MAFAQLPYEDIRVDQNPTQVRWRFTPLYKESGTGGLMMWQVAFNGHQLEMTHGYVNGAIRTDPPTDVEPKAGRTLQEQALQEARTRYRLKFRNDGYRPAGTTQPDVPQPQLASKWEPGKIKKWPVAVQVKLDGIRMMAKLIGDRVRARSRGNREFPHLDQIKADLTNFFPYLPYGAELDGELYSPNMNFQTLTSVVKREKTLHPRLGELGYYIFDIIYDENPSYNERYNLLVNAYTRFREDGNQECCFALLPTQYAYSDQEVLDYHRQYVTAGNEGIMIRKIPGPRATAKDIEESKYRPGRNNNLLKYKEFKDEEAMIVGVRDSEGTEKGAGTLEVVYFPKETKALQEAVVGQLRTWFQTPANLKQWVDHPEQGQAWFQQPQLAGVKVLNIRPRGSMGQRRTWLQQPELVVGKDLTIRFQELSEDGVPRFPVGVAVRDYE